MSAEGAAHVRRVLVVEDNPVTRKLVRLTLAQPDLAVEEAGDGAAALESVRRAMPDLILQDMILPDINGFDLASKIRELPGGAQVPILAFSGHLPAISQARAGGAVFTDYLVKPIEPSRLLALVRSYLAQPAAAAAGAGRTWTVLIADDDPIRTKILGLHLAERGAIVTTVPDGEAALRAIAASRPDVVVADVLMPRLDGFGLCIQVRSIPALAGLPVLLISSAYDDPADRDLARVLGAVELITLDPVRASMARVADRVAALAAAPPRAFPPPPPDAPGLLRGRLDRVMGQLDRQVALSRTYARRTALLEAELGILSGISRLAVGTKSGKFFVEEILYRTLDAAGISRGMVCLDRGGAALEVQVSLGFAEGAAADAKGLIGSSGTVRTLMAKPGPVVLDDRTADPAQRALLRALDLSMCLICGFGLADGSRGALLVGSKTQDVGDDWAGFGAALAGQVALAIDHGRTMTELSGSRETLRQVTDNIQEVFWMSSPRLDKMIYLSAGYERVWGRPVAEVYADPGAWAMAIHPEDRDRVWRDSLENMATAFDQEYRILRPNGELRWIRSRSFPVFDDQGRHQRTVGLSEDITAHVATRRGTQGEMEVAKYLGQAHPPGEEGTELPRVVGESMGWDAVAWWAPDPASGILRCVGFWSARPGALDGLASASRALVFPAGEGLPGRAWALREMVRVDRPGSDPGFCRTAAAAGAGIRAAVAVPVADGQDRFAVLECFLGDPLPDDSSMARGLEKLGRVIGRFCARRRAEHDLAESQARLQQAQKLEAIGQLAGGVAHDFNNLLTPILGYCELLQERLPAGDETGRFLGAIHHASERAVDLVKQLLLFSRRQEVEQVSLDLNAIVRDTDRMLGRLLGEHIQRTLELAGGLWPVLADAGQVGQILMNLSVNARDAMPGGGTLTIQTENVALDEDRVEGGERIPAGEYAVLRVSDTGAGMSPEILARIYEPFFTTKEPGRGTGLGLSTVFGIVRKAGGQVTVRSAPGAGATFSVHLPRLAAHKIAPAIPAVAPEPATAVAAVGTILLVEDEDAVRAIASTILRGAGYTVLEARHGGEALLLADRCPDPIDLLVTDLVMPELDGIALTRQLTAARPTLRALLVSGYARELGGTGVRELPADIAFLPKPYTPHSLLAKVREVLSAPVPPPLPVPVPA